MTTGLRNHRDNYTPEKFEAVLTDATNIGERMLAKWKDAMGAISEAARNEHITLFEEAKKEFLELVDAHPWVLVEMKYRLQAEGELPQSHSSKMYAAKRAAKSKEKK